MRGISEEHFAELGYGTFYFLLKIKNFAVQVFDEDILDYYIGDNFKGYLDDLRVYKKLLNQEEVTILHNLASDNNTCL